MQLGDGELPGVGAVAVVVQRQVGLVLRAPGFAPEHDRFVAVGEVAVDDVEHPPGCLAQPFGVHRAPRPGADAGGLVDQDLLGSGELLWSGLEGCLLGGGDDDADLAGGDRTDRVGLAGVVVLRSQQLSDAGAAGEDLARLPGQRGGPGVGAGGGLSIGDLAALGLTQHVAHQRGGLGLERGECPHQTGEVLDRLVGEVVGPGGGHRGASGGDRLRHGPRIRDRFEGGEAAGGHPGTGVGDPVAGGVLEQPHTPDSPNPGARWEHQFDDLWRTSRALPDLTSAATRQLERSVPAYQPCGRGVGRAMTP